MTTGLPQFWAVVSSTGKELRRYSGTGKAVADTFVTKFNVTRRIGPISKMISQEPDCPRQLSEVEGARPGELQPTGRGYRCKLTRWRQLRLSSFVPADLDCVR